MITSLGLPGIDQVGFVVPDIMAAMENYRPLFGEFALMNVTIDGADYRGENCDCDLKLAFAMSGNIQIELIELLAGQSPHGEFIAAGRSGMHHVRYTVADLDASAAQFVGLGYKAIWSKRFDENTAFTYLEKAGDPLLIELFETKSA